MSTSKDHMVLHMSAAPPVEIGGDQAERDACDAGEYKLEEDCPALLLAWQEEREKEVDASLQNAGHRGAQLSDGIEAAEVDPCGDDEEGIEDVSSALPGEAEEKYAARKKDSLSDGKRKQPQRKEATMDLAC